MKNWIKNFVSLVSVILGAVAASNAFSQASVNFPVNEGGNNWSHSHGSSGHFLNVCGSVIDELALDLNLNTPTFNSDAGKTVRAVADGQVVNFAGCASSFHANYGAVMVRHNSTLVLDDGSAFNPWYSGYLHMSNIATIGTNVSMGSPIGLVSNVSLDSIPAHLHMAVYVGQYPNNLVSINLKQVPNIQSRIASWFCGPSPFCYQDQNPTITLSNGVATSANTNSISSNRDFREFTFSVPNGSTNLSVDLFGLSADLDLYVRPQFPANVSNWSCRPFAGGVTNENCAVSIPSGRYFARVYGAATQLQTFNIRATWQAAGGNQILAVNKLGAGLGTVSSNPSGINCGSTCNFSFPANTSIILTATPASGSTFAGWGGDCSGASTSCSVTMSQARNVTATFNVGGLTQTLNVFKNGSGSGTVQSGPSTGGGNITCGTGCSAQFTQGTVVDLYATAASGSTFTGWSGDCFGSASCSVTMNQARNVTANFVSQSTSSQLLNGSAANAFTNSVSQNSDFRDYYFDLPSGSNNLSVQAYSMSGDVDLYLQPGQVPDLANYACRPYINGLDPETCTVPGPQSGRWFVRVYGFQTGLANFTVRADWSNGTTNFALSVSTVGSGSVTSNPAGINCPSNCVVGFAQNTTVQLIATPGANASFAGWTGACAGNSPNCSVLMSQAQELTANFGATSTYQVTLTVNANAASFTPTLQVSINNLVVDVPGPIIQSYGPAMSNGQSYSMSVVRNPNGLNCQFTSGQTGTVNGIAPQARILCSAQSELIFFSGFE